MSHLSARFPDFSDTYVGAKMRAMVTHLEQLFARVHVDDTRPAYPVTANTTLTALDEMVLVDTSGGDVTITLPEISDDMIRAKREFEVVKTEAGGVLYVTPTGTDTIMGEPDAIITAQWTAIRFRATTGNWVAI